MEVTQYLAFAYGLFLLISSNAKSLRRTRRDIQNENEKQRNDYAAHGLRRVFVRLSAILATVAITVRYADLKLFWGIFLVIYLAGFAVTSWLMTKRLPKELPKMTTERVGRQFKVKWWQFAFQLILLALWVYTWRHLYIQSPAN